MTLRSMKFRWLVRIALVLINVVALTGAAITIALLFLLPHVPDIESIRDMKLKVPLRIYSADGLLIGEYGEERRDPVSIENTPPLLIAAILAAEDDRYYDHVGVDYQGILRAIWVNVQSGARTQGASTITMQVARNYFLSAERTYYRKAVEAMLALKLERLLDKDEILELYINKIFLGQRAYGFGAAAASYYGKPLAELSLAQLSMLAALPKAPSRVNPVNNPEAAKNRRDYILGRMYELQYISQDTYDSAISEPLTAARHVTEVELNAPYVAEFVRQQLLEEFGEEIYEDGYQVLTTIIAKNQQAARNSLRKGLMDYDMRHGYRGRLDNVDLAQLSTDELRLESLTSFNSSESIIPAVIVEIEDDHVTALTRNSETITITFEDMKWARLYYTSRSRGPAPKSPRNVVELGDIVHVQPKEDEQWMLAQIPEVQGALIAINPRDGAIEAMVGGFDYYLGKFNRATQAVRQLGSTIKPFVYSAALERGFTAASLVSGAPVVVEDETSNLIWRPENYSGKFYGPTRLRKSLELSLNLVSVRLVRGMSTGYTIDHLGRFGFAQETLPDGLSIALGSAGDTPINVVTAYSVFANGGFKVEPYIIDVVKVRDGTVVKQGRKSVVCQSCLPPAQVDRLNFLNSGGDNEAEIIPGTMLAERVISSANAYIMNDMLKTVIQSGTGKKARSLGRTDLGGKTGTTNKFDDAWFSGFNSDTVATVWVGFDNPSDLGRHEAGSKAALPIWIDFMETALEGKPNRKQPVPDNVVTATIDSESGKAVQQGHRNSMKEIFLFGTEPKFNQMEQMITSDGSMGLDTDSQKIEELF